MDAELQNLLERLGNEAHMRVTEDTRIDFLKKQVARVGLKNFSIPIFSVTGTNGKGSTAEALKTIYKLSNYRVGVFTSPHLIAYNERIRINDELISDEDLKKVFQWILNQDKQNELSFFERLFFAAWKYFELKNVDLLILEVGVGGRLDATNLLDADLVIITTVDLDHQHLLGDTVEKIAFEKAGLFKANKLAIYADDPMPQTVHTQASQLNVDLTKFNTDYFIKRYPSGWSLCFKNKVLEFSNFPSIHLSAMASALVAVMQMQNVLPVPESIFIDAIKQVKIFGRRQWVNDYCTAPILLDVAHNLQAVSLLKNEIEKVQLKGKVYCLFSALKDKDCDKIVQKVNKINFLWYTVPLKTERSHNQESMSMVFNSEKISHYWFENAIEAFKVITSEANANDLIVVFGSFYLVGEIMNHMHQEGKHVF